MFLQGGGNALDQKDINIDLPKNWKRNFTEDGVICVQHSLIVNIGFPCNQAKTMKAVSQRLLCRANGHLCVARVAIVLCSQLARADGVSRVEARGSFHLSK